METTKRRWGKPITQVQVFTPQQFVAVCEPGDPEYTADCGVGIAESPYTELVPYLTDHTSSVQVTLKSNLSEHLNWNKCTEKHTVKRSQLINGSMDVDHISKNGTNIYTNPEYLFGYKQSGAMHIFYIDLSKPIDLPKTHS